MVVTNCYNLSSHQVEGLRQAKEATGISQSELLRRILDRFPLEEQLNAVVPSMSGHILKGEGR